MELRAALFADSETTYLQVAAHWHKLAAMAELVTQAEAGIQATLEELSKAIDARLNDNSRALTAPEPTPHFSAQSRPAVLNIAPLHLPTRSGTRSLRSASHRGPKRLHDAYH
jgi:hypothetical protein